MVERSYDYLRFVHSQASKFYPSSLPEACGMTTSASNLVRQRQTTATGETFSISCQGHGLAREKQSTVEPETSHGPTGGCHVGKERRVERELTQIGVSGNKTIHYLLSQSDHAHR